MLPQDHGMTQILFRLLTVPHSRDSSSSSSSKAGMIGLGPRGSVRAHGSLSHVLRRQAAQQLRQQQRRLPSLAKRLVLAKEATLWRISTMGNTGEQRPEGYQAPSGPRNLVDSRIGSSKTEDQIRAENLEERERRARVQAEKDRRRGKGGEKGSGSGQQRGGSW